MNLRHLDVLRAGLALMVLIGHARMMLWTGWQNWRALPHEWWETTVTVFFSGFRFGHQAVMVFFALSGFFIHWRAATALAEGRSTNFQAPDYLGRRARRILPPYFAALLFTVLLDLIGRSWWPRLYLAQTGDVWLDSNFSHAGYGWEAVVPALLAQPNLFGIRFGGNGPLWSIGHEVFYYLLYPLFMTLWQRRRWLAYWVGMGTGVACWFLPLAGWWSGMLAAYPIWLSGALMAEWLAAGNMRASVRRWAWILCGLGSLGALTGLHCVADSSLLSLGLNMLMGMSAIAAFAWMPFDMLNLRVGRIMEWLGIRSYSLYIFHFPVLVLLSAWCIQTFGERPFHGWLAAAGVALSLGFGLLAFHLVEHHFLPKRLRAA